MESYCLKCRKHKENIDPKVSNSSNGRVIILSNVQCAVVKNQDLLKIKTQKFLGVHTKWTKVLRCTYKMNEIVNKFLLTGDKFMPEMHLKQPGSTYSACRPFTKKNERTQKFKETGDTNNIYKNELDKACF